MCIRLEISLAWFVTLLLGNEHAMAVAGSAPQVSVSDVSGLLHNGTTSSEWGDREDTLSDAVASFFSGNFAAVQRSADQAVLRSGPSAVVIGAGSNMTKPQKSYVFAFDPKRLGGLLALLFFAGIVTVGLKRLVTPAAQFPAIESMEPVFREPGATAADEQRIEKAIARLENVKGLLPTASRLALAVGSAESKRLLADVEQIVGNAPHMTMDSKGIEDSVASALGALCRLQQAAIEGAAAIMQADSSLPGFPSLGFRKQSIPEITLDLEKHTDQKTVKAFLQTFRSFYESDGCLLEGSHQAAKRVSAQKLFEDEMHGERLLRTALAMETLKDISACRRRLAAMGADLGRGVLQAAKGLLLAERENSMADIKAFKDFVEVRVALERSTENAALRRTSIEHDSALAALESNVTRIGSLLAELHWNTAKTRESPTLLGAIAEGGEVGRLDGEARELMMQCASVANSLPAIPGHLNSRTSQLVTDAIEKARSRALSASANLLLVVREARRTLGQRNADAAQQLSCALKKRFFEEATELEAREKSRRHDSSSSLGVVQWTGTVEVAIEELKKANDELVRQTIDKGAAEMLSCGSRLAVFLENDLNAIVNEVNRVAARGSTLSGFAKRKYQEVQRQFDAALETVKDASTLAEAAEAAAELRMRAVTIQRFFAFL